MPTALGSEFRINTYTANNQANPSVSGLSNGNFVVTWQSAGQDGSVNGIYGQLYSATGTKVGNELQINTITYNQQFNSAVTGLTNGGFVVTWQSYGHDGDNNGIYGRLYSATGAPLNSEFLINTYTTGEQNLPAVAGLTNGQFVVTWQSLGQDGSYYGTYGQLYSATGAKVGNEFRVNTHTASDQNLPSVTGLSNGRFVVTWSSEGQDGSGRGIYGQLYSASGTALGNEFRLNTYTANQQDQASVAGLSNGHFVAAWQSNLQDGSEYGIYGQRFSLLTVVNFDQTLNYTEDTPALLNNPVIAAAANDQASVTLTLSVPAAGQLSTATAGSVTSTYNSVTGVWSASGPIANLNTLLAGVKFIPVPDGSANVVIQATISDNDATVTSNLNLMGIAVNDAPVLVNNRLTIGQAQTVVLTTSHLSASDDSASANALQFTVSNVQRGQFRLNGVTTTSFTQQDISQGKVSFVHDGTVTAPSYSVRVSDGSLTSSTQAASITFNAAPVLVNNSLAVGQAQTVVLTTSHLSASDDSASANALQFTVSNVQRGQFRLNGVTTTSFTQQDISQGKVSFVHDGTVTAPSYSVRVSDGSLTSSVQAASISFNRMPVLSSGNQTISYYSRTAPVIIDNQLSILAEDSPILTRATISISQGLVPTEDELSVITPASLSATYEPTTGVLLLTGNATVADYQQTLRQVAYRSQADVPTTHPRTISFSVFDGLLDSQPVNSSLAVIQVNRAPLLINPRTEIAVQVNQPFSLSMADTFSDPDGDELTLGLLPADGQALPDWLSVDTSRQVLTGTARKAGSYNFTLFANDTSHAQARMPMTLVAKAVTNNALILGTALGLGLSGSLLLLCCLGVLVTAGAIGVGYERKLAQQQALSRRPYPFADLLRKELHLNGVADFSQPSGKAYVDQVNYLITYDEVFFQLYIRCSNDKQLPNLAKELAKHIKLHFKEQKIALQANLLQKETPKLMLSFNQREAFFIEALNRAGYRDLLVAPVELTELATKPESNAQTEALGETKELEDKHAFNLV